MDTICHPITLLMGAGILSYYLELSRPAALCLAFVLLNVKALPLAYHKHGRRATEGLEKLQGTSMLTQPNLISQIRILPSLLRLYGPAFLRGRGTASPKSGPAQLFETHTARTRACVLECDVNLHKSNSTFFADLDVSRAALLSRLFAAALRCCSAGEDAAASGRANKGGANLVLAGTQASFLREIKPLAAYDVRSRVLAWDAKWLYVLTYFTRPRPGASSFGPAAGMGGGMGLALEAVAGGPAVMLKDETCRRDVFAVAVSKYVVKAGRVTVPPERLFEAGGFLRAGGDRVVETEKRDGLGPEKVEAMRMEGLEFVKGCMA